jgi:ribosome biogenesis GTPase
LVADSALYSGQIVSAHGRHYAVDIAGEIVACFPRGKRSAIACGDRVAVLRTAPGQGVIEAVSPRRSLLYRSDPFREKLIAANVDQMIIVVAAVPSFYRELVDRCLVAAEHQGIRALIVLNKADLVDETRAARAQLQVYEQLDYEVLALSARADVSALRSRLDGCLSVLVGQSGMGKSTLVNALVPHAGAAVREISLALDSGRHTTTHARLYRLDERSALIDSPGMQAFGLHHVPAAELAACFPELRPFLGHCRFSDCAHVSEPGCAVQCALEDGLIDANRLGTYRRLAAEARKTRSY